MKLTLSETPKTGFLATWPVWCLVLGPCFVVWFLRGFLGSFLLEHYFIMKLVKDLLALFSCAFVTFPYGVLGQVWYVIVLIPDLCFLLLCKGREMLLLWFNCVMAICVLCPKLP